MTVRKGLWGFLGTKGNRYLFTGGGTGGHVTPNLALIAEVRRRDPGASILYVGSAHGYENRLAEQQIPFQAVPCAQSVSPRHPLKFLWTVGVILAGVCRAAWIMLRWRPDLVIATGGYVSVPPVLAAALLGRRVYLQEQNAHPGAANRALARFATRVGVSFERTLNHFPAHKCVYTGYPVRSRMSAGSREAARTRFGIAPGQKVVFVVGGSMGSRSINRGIVEALKTLLRDESISVIHSTGLFAGNEYHAFDDTRERLKQLGLSTEIPGRYFCRRFIEEIHDAYAIADLVIARSGAGTLMELAAVGKPSILIPKSDASGQHQLENATAFVDVGAAEIFFEEPSDEEGRTVTRVYGDQLAHRVRELLGEEETLLRMGRQAHRMLLPDALQRNVDEIMAIASGAPLLRMRSVEVKVGSLLDESGRTHELLFQSNLVSAGALADVRLLELSKDRAFVQQHVVDGTTEFNVVRRFGNVCVNGDPVARRSRIRSEDVLTVGPNRFTFRVTDRGIEREERPLAAGRKLLSTGVGTLVSRGFGFAREAFTAAQFGLTGITDIMSVGFRVSNFLRAVFAETAVDSAFLPTFVQLIRSGRVDSANRLLSTVMKFTIAATTVVTLLSMLSVPLWMGYVTPGFEAKGLLTDTILLVQVMSPYLILISVAAVLAAVLKAFNNYALPANASIMFSLGVIAGVAMYPRFGIVSLGYGVLLGGVGQILVQLPPLFGREIRQGHGLRWPRGADFRQPALRRVARVTPNILADTVISQAGMIVDASIASFLAKGMIAALGFGRTLFLLPFGVIAQTINTVILKELSEGMATREKAWVRGLVVSGINWTVFTLIPISVAMIVLADPITLFVMAYHKMTPEQAHLVALALRYYSIGLLGWGLVSLTGRFFSAYGRLGPGTITNLAALIIQVTASLLLVKTPLGFAGIAVSTSLTFTAAAIVRLILLNHLLNEEEAGFTLMDLWPSFFKTSMATAAAAIAAAMSFSAVRHFSSFPLVLSRMFQLGVPLFFGGCAFAGTAFLAQSGEFFDLLDRFRRRRGVDVAQRPIQDGRPTVPQWMPPHQLLAWAEQNRAQLAHHNIHKRVAQLLDRPQWQHRNIGVKLAGMLQTRSFRGRLAAMATDRKPAQFIHLALGGDYSEPGFVRRNAIMALGLVGDPDTVTENALMTALDDGYYEVRAAAAAVLGKFAPMLTPHTRDRAITRLAELTRGRCFETAMNAVRALGAVARDDSVLPVLERLHYHHNWQVRDAVVCAYEELHRRGVVADSDRLLALIDDVLITCDAFQPRFRLKEDLARVRMKLESSRPAPGGNT